MKEKGLYGIWAFLYSLCAILGFIPNPAGFGKFMLVLLAVLFFIPGGLILRLGIQTEEKAILRRLRMVCICSLAVTAVLLVANIWCVLAPQIVGKILYALLVVLTSPMICAQYWVLSMFLWACLLIGTFRKNKKTH